MSGITPPWEEEPLSWAIEEDGTLMKRHQEEVKNLNTLIKFLQEENQMLWKRVNNVG